MNQIAELVLSRSIAFEKALQNHVGAEGAGLGAMIRSLRVPIPQKLREKLLFVAKERNRVVHEGTAIDVTRFTRVAEEARALLNPWLLEHKSQQLSKWLDQCPLDLDQNTRQRVVSTVQHKPLRKTASSNRRQTAKENYQLRKAKK